MVLICERAATYNILHHRVSSLIARPVVDRRISEAASMQPPETKKWPPSPQRSQGLVCPPPTKYLNSGAHTNAGITIPARLPRPFCAAVSLPFPTSVTLMPCLIIIALMECRHAAGKDCSRNIAAQYWRAFRSLDA
jgi:hypothetical protein